MKCEFCEKEKADVEYNLDPYILDLFGEEVLVKICDDCYDERVRDI